LNLSCSEALESSVLPFSVELLAKVMLLAFVSDLSCDLARGGGDWEGLRSLDVLRESQEKGLVSFRGGGAVRSGIGAACFCGAFGGGGKLFWKV
jgi:hypothetical protein